MKSWDITILCVLVLSSLVLGLADIEVCSKVLLISWIHFILCHERLEHNHFVYRAPWHFVYCQISSTALRWSSSSAGRFQLELSMGPFCVTRSNPLTHFKWKNLDPTRPNPIQLTNLTVWCNQSYLTVL